MEQDVRNDSRVCQIPPFLKEKGLNLYLKPNPILVAVSLTFILATTGLVYYWMTPPPGDDGVFVVETPYAVIAIDGDANFSDTALLEGWPGDGSPENPFIIDGLEIDVARGFGNCISISNTRVSFTISNCNLTGGCAGTIDRGDGIYLENVTNGELVNNICNGHINGIVLYGSSSNTVFNNTCPGNLADIVLDYSDYNTVANNTCSNRGGIFLSESDSNIVEYNTCTNNLGSIYLTNSDYNTVANNNCSSNWNHGISLESSDSNTVSNNICDGNGNHGISLESSDSNTVSNNTCNNNNVNDEDFGDGIYLYDSDANTVVDNICNNNDIGIEIYVSSCFIFENNICNDNRIDLYIHHVRGIPVEFDPEVLQFDGFVGAEFDPEVLQFIGFVGVMGFAVITFLGAGWRMVKLSRVESDGE